MNTILLQMLIILTLLVANGIFAMAEISVVSARKGRLKTLADDGVRSAARALALAREPGRFLSTVQIGITLVGILAGAVGGATLSNEVAEIVARVPSLESYSRVIGLVIVVGGITYVSVIVGELVPKRIGLNNPEKKAMLLAGPMSVLSRLALPIVWFFTASTEIVLKAFGLGKEPEMPPTEEEVALLLEQGTTAGVFHRAEREMIEGVFRLDERSVAEIMTPRDKVVFLNVADSDEIIGRKIAETGHSQFPVYEGTPNHVIGMISVKTLWANTAIHASSSLRDQLTPPLYIPSAATLVQLLQSFKQSRKHVALVTNEHGEIRGIVSLIDVMKAIVGDFQEPVEHRAAGAVQRDDGSWLVDGEMKLAELARRFGFRTASAHSKEISQTLDEFVRERLEHVPAVGEHFEHDAWRFEIIDMDGLRVDKVLLNKPARRPGNAHT